MSGALPQVADLVHRASGIVIREAQLASLEAALARIEPDMDAERFLRESDDPLGGQKLVGRLLDEVTVKETYFLRERRDLEAIDWHGHLAAARARGAAGVRVWVAGCATGDEAYTLAILASEAFGSVQPPVSIIATDISGQVLERAAEARYSARSVRELEGDARERYLLADGNRWRVALPIRSLVRFRRHNLVLEPAPPPGEAPFDLIACRNVLIYFDPPTVERVIYSLELALAPDGALILGAADRLSGSADRLARLDTGPPDRRGPDPGDRVAPPRRPLGHFPADRTPASVEAALAAADEGSLERAIEITDRLLARDPLDADAYLVRGMAELSMGLNEAAAAALRRALYVDPSFGFAGFLLGRAHEANADPAGARRAYWQALRTLDPDDDRHHAILDQVDLGDIAAACRVRLEALR